MNKELAAEMEALRGYLGDKTQLVLDNIGADDDELLDDDNDADSNKDDDYAKPPTKADLCNDDEIDKDIDSGDDDVQSLGGGSSEADSQAHSDAPDAEANDEDVGDSDLATDETDQRMTRGPTLNRPPPLDVRQPPGTHIIDVVQGDGRAIRGTLPPGAAWGDRASIQRSYDPRLDDPVSDTGFNRTGYGLRARISKQRATAIVNGELWKWYYFTNPDANPLEDLI